MSARAVPIAAGLAMVGAAACWGLATVATKGVLAVVPPFTLLGIQLTASAGFLWATVLATGRSGPFDRAARRGALCGVLEPGLAYGIGVPGLALTSAASATVIGATEPMMIAVLGWLLWRQAIGARVVLGIAVATGGGLLITLGGGDDAPRQMVGDGMILAGVACASLYVLASSRLLGNRDPLPLAALQHSVGLVLALGLLAVAVGVGREPWPTAIPPGILAIAAITGVVQYALAFWLYLSGLKQVPATQAGLYLTLVPIFGVAGAVLGLGETLTAAQILGCALVTGAVATVVSAR